MFLGGDYQKFIGQGARGNGVEVFLTSTVKCNLNAEKLKGRSLL
jgi:hypothetical protein